MSWITGEKDSKFAIPANRIDWIKSEDAAGGRVLIKIGTGGMTHHFNFDGKEDAAKFYDKVMNIIDEL